MPDILDEFKAYLLREGCKITRQRFDIVRVFFEFKGHPTAEELLAAVRAVDTSASQATVYRTLKLLCDAGLAEERQFGDGTARFERRSAREHHDHLICESCGKTVEFFSPEIERLQDELAAQHKFEPTRHRLYLYGICASCRRKAGKTKATG
jgi:Fur family ferric uptake transcriptional regulator